MKKNNLFILALISFVFLTISIACNPKNKTEPNLKIENNNNQIPKCTNNFELIKEEISKDSCVRFYNVCDFEKIKNRWWVLAEFAYNEVLDPAINYGEFYFLDNTLIDKEQKANALLKKVEIKEKTICKFIYGVEMENNVIADPFNIGKYKDDSEKDK